MNTRPNLEESKQTLAGTVAATAVQGRLDYLDGVRALAALYVLLHHAATNLRYGDLLPRNFFTDLLSFHHDAVVVFLVVSGFCLMLPVVRAGGFLKGGMAVFFKRRAWRILPPYLLTMVISLILIRTILGENTVTVWNNSIGSGVTFKSVWLHLLMLHDALPHTAHQINYVLWSISVEWRIYFLFPLFVWLWRVLGPTVTTVGVVFGSLVVAYLLPIMTHRQLTNMSAHFTGLFAIGMLAATVGFSDLKRYKDLLVSLNWRKMCFWCTLGFITVCVFRLIPSVNAHLSSMLVDVVTALWAGVVLIWGGRCSDGVLRHLLANWLVVRIGAFSYSLYLVHPPILQIVWKYLVHPLNLPPVEETLVMCSVGSVICVIVSYGFYLLVERPFLNTRGCSVCKRSA